MDKRRKYTEDDIKEMVYWSKKLGSCRAAGRELGINYQTVLDHCRANGVSFPGVMEKSKSSRKKIVDGITWIWNSRGYYRGTVDHKRISLSRYLYRKIYGEEMPKETTIFFKDGDRENYDLDNLEFISKKEWGIRHAASDPESCRKGLDAARKAKRENVARNPRLAKLWAARTWRTRRSRDPDNSWAEKMAQTKREKAAERGYFYTVETLQRMSAAHIGLTKEKIKIRRLENQKQDLRKKMGM